MTELDIMKHAKSYLDSLSQGIDPISGQPVPNDSVLNNVRLEKCFRYVSGVLEQVIANGGKVVSGAPVPFYITPEELQRISPAQEPLRISQLAKLITDAVDDPQRIPLRATVIPIGCWKRALSRSGSALTENSSDSPRPRENPSE